MGIENNQEKAELVNLCITLYLCMRMKETANKSTSTSKKKYHPDTQAKDMLCVVERKKKRERPASEH